MDPAAAVQLSTGTNMFHPTSHPPTLGSIVEESAEQREALHTRNKKGG
jgi:hypothetical protein